MRRQAGGTGNTANRPAMPYNTRRQYPFAAAMFNPSQHDVRRFFCETFRKSHAREVLTPMEAIAADWISQHPEYHDTLADLESALEANYSVDAGQTNPFLHLSMHLSIAEQISVDQPPGVRAAFQTLAKKYNSEHEAHHQIMECLGEMIWNSQRTGLPPDGAAYIEALRKRCTG
jgi:hypothetical protein